MALILDTHIVLWWKLGDTRLGPDIQDKLLAEADSLFISVASVWEGEIKRANGKMPPGAVLPEAIVDLGIKCLPIVESDAVRAAALPLHHRDPFDRMIIAHALNHRMTLVSHDRIFGQYAVPILWV